MLNPVQALRNEEAQRQQWFAGQARADARAAAASAAPAPPPRLQQEDEQLLQQVRSQGI